MEDPSLRMMSTVSCTTIVWRRERLLAFEKKAKSALPLRETKRGLLHFHAPLLLVGKFVFLSTGSHFHVNAKSNALKRKSSMGGGGRGVGGQGGGGGENSHKRKHTKTRFQKCALFFAKMKSN